MLSRLRARSAATAGLRHLELRARQGDTPKREDARSARVQLAGRARSRILDLTLYDVDCFRELKTSRPRTPQGERRLDFHVQSIEKARLHVSVRDPLPGGLGDDPHAVVAVVDQIAGDRKQHDRVLAFDRISERRRETRERRVAAPAPQQCNGRSEFGEGIAIETDLLRKPRALDLRSDLLAVAENLDQPMAAGRRRPGLLSSFVAGEQPLVVLAQ
jgi:hypothetical protein